MSPKNKGKFGKGKPKVEESDEFVDGITRLAKRIQPYAVRLGVTLGVVTLGIFAVLFYKHCQHVKQDEATVAYVESLDVARRRVVTEDEKKEIDERKDPNKKPDPKNPEDAELPPEEVYTSAVDRARDTVSKLEGIDTSTGAGGQSRLVKATALLDLGKFDEAVEEYRAYADSDPSPELKTLALEGIGYALEGKAMAAKDATAQEAGLREALDAFRKMQPDEAGPRRDYAMFHEARILAKLQEKNAAIELFEKILELDPPSDLTPKVNNRLAVLKGSGSSAAPAPAPPDEDESGTDGDDGAGDEGKGDGAGDTGDEPAGDDSPAKPE